MILIHVKFQISCPADDRGKFCQQRIFINLNPAATFNEKICFASGYDENNFCQRFIQIFNKWWQKNIIQTIKTRIQNVVNYWSRSQAYYLTFINSGSLQKDDSKVRVELLDCSKLFFFHKKNKSQWSSFISKSSSST